MEKRSRGVLRVVARFLFQQPQPKRREPERSGGAESVSPPQFDPIEKKRIRRALLREPEYRGGPVVRVQHPHPSEERSLVLHVGAHKTATSSLQQILRHLAADLGRRGVFCFARHVPRTPRGVLGPSRVRYHQHLAPCLKVLRQEEPGSTQWNEAGQFLRYAVEACAQQADTVLISSEGLLGGRPARGEGLYPNAERFLNSARDVFSNRRVRVILYIRRQDRFLESCYLQDIHEGKKAAAFHEYLRDDVGDVDLSWSTYADRIASVVGGENLSVREFESIREGFELFAVDYLRHVVNPEGLTIPTVNVNPSLSTTGLELAQLIMPRVARDAWPEFLTLLQRHFSAAGGGARVELFTSSQRAAILQRYREDVEQALAKYPGWCAKP